MLIVQYHEQGLRWKIGEYVFSDDAIKFALSKVDDALPWNKIYIYEERYGACLGYAHLGVDGSSEWNDLKMKENT